MLKAIRKWLEARSAPYFNLDGYMNRRYVLVTPWFTARLHNILASDHDRAFHDHPFNYMTIVLEGGYYEHTPEGVKWIKPGSVLFRKASSLHRLEIPEGQTAWTLFFTGTRIRKWGFQTDNGWVPYNEYLKEKDNVGIPTGGSVPITA